MKKTEKSSITILIMIGLFFTIVGIIALIIAISTQQEESTFMSKAESCTAQVTNIDSYTTSKSHGTKGISSTVTHYVAYVSFTANGVKYNNVKISDVSSSIETGDQLTIYYDPSNPTKARLKPNSALNIPRIIGSVIIIVFGMFILLLFVIAKKNNSKAQQQISPNDVIPDANSMNSTSTSYNGYDNNPQAFSNSQDIYNPNPEQTYDDYGVNPFDTYNGYSQNDNSNDFNSQQSNPFDTYNGYSQNDNSNDSNSQQSNPFDTYNGYSQNDNSKPKSPFDRYK